jgi:hypothetical protein
MHPRNRLSCLFVLSNIDREEERLLEELPPAEYVQWLGPHFNNIVSGATTFSITTLCTTTLCKMDLIVTLSTTILGMTVE